MAQVATDELQMIFKRCFQAGISQSLLSSEANLTTESKMGLMKQLKGACNLLKSGSYFVVVAFIPISSGRKLPQTALLGTRQHH